MSAKAAQRVKEIVDELSDVRLADLSDLGQSKAHLEELDACLNEVRGFAQLVEGVIDKVPAGAASSRRGRSKAKGTTRARATARTNGRPRGRRGPGEFSATPFIASCVEEAGRTGIRPREIVEKVQTAAPGQHVRPSALVSTILTRLKKGGFVRRRAGKWYPTGKTYQR